MGMYNAIIPGMNLLMPIGGIFQGAFIALQSTLYHFYIYKFPKKRLRPLTSWMLRLRNDFFIFWPSPFQADLTESQGSKNFNVECISRLFSFKAGSVLVVFEAIGIFSIQNKGMKGGTTSASLGGDPLGRKVCLKN